ncbi:hypothetical protein [Yoonia sp. SS1-5]|uniref:Sulfotransferase family protein n=1 Tax=Yoonia rhodophyticola TaxID=3137370 RepID=A0AAN0ML18_9RHOB
MLVSHSCRFIVFSEPLGACPWVAGALLPWLDQPVASDWRKSAGTNLFSGMSPVEAEIAFDLMGRDFADYTRIAIIQNPYARLTKLYDRIAQARHGWRLRRRIGLSNPDFHRWLRTLSNKPCRKRMGRRQCWQSIGAWSLDAWCADRVTHVVRAEFANAELGAIFGDMGFAPAFGDHAEQHQSLGTHLRRYDAPSRDLVADRYAPDLALYDKRQPDLRLVA